MERQKEQKQGPQMGIGLETLPSCVLITAMLPKLELETLCSLACVSRAMNSSVSQALPSLSSLNLSAFSANAQILSSIVGGCRGLNSLTLNCLRLDDSSLAVFLGARLQELNLLCCSLMSYQVLASIGEACPNLRVLVLELVDQESPQAFKINMDRMLNGCLCLESLSIKIRWRGVGANPLQPFRFFLPKTLKSIKLQPVLEEEVIHFTSLNDAFRNYLPTANVSTPVSKSSFGFALQRLSLVLDVISDQLIVVIGICDNLAELDLEDRPIQEPLPNHDLTSVGLMSLASSFRLKGLSLVRSRQNCQVSFKGVDDMGMFVFSKYCTTLESVRLFGFSRVSDAGYASVLQSCQNLKKFEVRNAFLMSDLAFVDLTRFSCSLVEVKLLSCCLITCETVNQLTSSGVLEVLDLYGCRSIADSCLISIASLHSLTMLNLSGADISDYGLSVLGTGNPPITHLCLRNCKGVTDEGVLLLFLGGGTIGKTLSSLDLGHIPGISDKAVLTIAVAGTEITELCLRYCSSMTNSSLEALATRKQDRDDCKLLRRLDLFNCKGLSADSIRLLKRPFFPGLHWLGIGNTRLNSKGCPVLSEIGYERPWLTICLDGCEMGCHDGWQFHRVP
ncbi:F-box protein At-B [Rosa rugosa]|uniref:F-box protein At-B n=1 Tax=Rosa rugosa TaxID=74645 RepID=UPI002B416ECF|nr:F-box protein At-B [Rosa rugosa]